MKLLGATGSHVGNVREANQDRVFFRGLVAALADGMGGHQGGERAAELAITEFREAGETLSEGDLVEVVLEANRQVHDHAADNGLPGMGTTVVAMTLHEDNTITVANVGDSRAYWLRGDYMGQVTEDHSFVEDLVRQGRLTPDEAATHPQRNILTRAVGIGAEVEVDRFPIPEPQVGDRFLLCSDGLFNELSEEDILDILLEAGDPADTATALIEATLQTPCRDNVTVAVVDLVADDDPRLEAQDADDNRSKVITAPMPIVSKSTLHEPNGEADAPPGEAVGNGASPANARLGTLLLDDGEDTEDVPLIDGGQAVSDGVDTDPDDPELYLETTELQIVEDEPHAVQPRSRWALVIGVAVLLGALLAGGAYLARDYARSGFHIATDDSGQLLIVEGRPDGFLVFGPAGETETGISETALDDDQRTLIGQQFDTHEEAMELVAGFSASEGGDPAPDDDSGAGTAPSDSSQTTGESSSGNQGSTVGSTVTTQG